VCRKVWRHAHGWRILIGLDSSSKMRAAKQLATPTHSQYNENDRSRVARLSKIAHKSKSPFRSRGQTKAGLSPRMTMMVIVIAMKIDRQARARRRGLGSRAVESHGRIRVRQFELPPTVETHPVSAAFDGEHPAQVTVPAAENELENRWQFHKSCARCRRSQLPFTSSQSSRERTLARARAIAQSAAP
jgi:hypothetical protein